MPVVDSAFEKSILDNLNDLASMMRDFHYFIHHKMPKNTPSVTLDTEEASLYWSAALAETLASNAISFRNGLKFNDEIDEQLVWPDPGPMSGDDVDNLLETVEMTGRMEASIFRLIMTFYPIKKKLSYTPRTTIHDVLYELVVNQNEYIDSENEKEYHDYPISYLDPPAAPSGSQGVGYSHVFSLHRIQVSLHRFLQAYMQVMSFIPVHLRLARARATALAATAPGRMGPLKFHPKKKKPIPKHKKKD
jgi:hypothetical protein